MEWFACQTCPFPQPPAKARHGHIIGAALQPAFTSDQREQSKASRIWQAVAVCEAEPFERVLLP
jgi:hypothetical protein